MTPTIDLLCSHRSIRAFTEQGIDDAQRSAIIAAAQAASTSSFYNVLPLSVSLTAPCASSAAHRRAAVGQRRSGVLGVLRRLQPPPANLP